MRRTSVAVTKRSLIAIAVGTAFLALTLAAPKSAYSLVPYSFGSNDQGATGQGTTVGGTLVATPIDETNLAGKMFAQVSAGNDHSLLLATDGEVFSFGHNGNGRTGLNVNSGNTLVATPIDTTNLVGQSPDQVSAGPGFSLLKTDDGSVFSFGANNDGQTGLGVTNGFALVATPIVATNLAGETIAQVAAGANHSLLLANDGTVCSFGTNAHGETGLGTDIGYTVVATPIDTGNLAGKSIAAMSTSGPFNLLLADDGTVYSFGLNSSGRTGLGTALGNTLVATPIDTTNLAGKRIMQISAGHSHGLLLADDGSVFSFGSNDSGRTGLATSFGDTLIATPIDTTNLGGRRIAKISAGTFHSLLLAEDGTVYSFGLNSFGRTGLGTDVGSTLVATPIDATNLAGLRILDISAGNSHSLLLAVPEPGCVVLLLTVGFPALMTRRRCR